MRSKQYFTSIKNNPHEISTDPKLPIRMPQEYNEQVYTLYFQLYDKMDSERGKLVKVQNSYLKRVE